MNDLHPVDRLFHKLKEISPYPHGVVPVPERMEGTAFFPGGAGLWDARAGDPLPPLPLGQVMVLGHDFDSEAGYDHSRAHSGENLRSPTWRNLLWLLSEVGVPARSCFFTNAYMGLRAGNAKNTGRFPGARSPDFVRQCQVFLAHQIATQRPRLILTLGVYVPAVIAPLSADLAGWARCERFRALDVHGPPMLPVVRFQEPINVTATVAALTHPSLWHRCVLERSYGSLQGREAELHMLHEAVAISGVHAFSPQQ